MSNQTKIDFISQHLDLSDEELARQTGWNNRKVRRFREKLQEKKSFSDRPSPTQNSSSDYRFWKWGLAAVIPTLLFYLPALSCSFLNWDDFDLVVHNQNLNHFNLDFLSWAFTTHKTYWIPLVWISLALDYQIGGSSSFIYHLDNLLIHGLNTLLIYWLSFQLFQAWEKRKRVEQSAEKKSWYFPGACLTAIIFGLHPLHVESVAWVSERKDVLYALFFILSLCFYLAYVSSASRRWLKYGLSLLIFAAALASKPMAATLPVVLVLLDIWPLRRFENEKIKCLFDKIPFFFGSLVLAFFTLRSSTEIEFLSTMKKIPLEFRIFGSFHSIAFYLEKMVLPWNLSAYYPFPDAAEVRSAEYLGSILVVLVILFFGWHYRNSKPYFTSALGFYLITLAPVSGLIQLGSQAMADRYTYLPLLGFFLVFSGWFASRSWKWKNTVMVGIFSIALILGSLTVRQIGFWKDSVSLWENAKRANALQSFMVINNLANAYYTADRLPESLENYDKAISIDPSNALPHEGKAMVFYDMGQVQQAVEELQKAVSMEPANVATHQKLWFAYNRMGLYEKSLAEAQEIIRLAPGSPEGYDRLAITYGSKGFFDKSIEASKKALELNPSSPQYQANLATTYQRAGRSDEAIGVYLKAIQLDPYSAISFFNLGNSYLSNKRYPQAIEALERASVLQPDNQGIREKLALAYQLNGSGQGNKKP